MPSSHPIPSLAALCLSLYASDRRIERLPVIVEFEPYQMVNLVSGARAGWGSARDPHGEAL